LINNSNILAGRKNRFKAVLVGEYILYNNNVKVYPMIKYRCGPAPT